MGKPYGKPTKIFEYDSPTGETLTCESPDDETDNIVVFFKNPKVNWWMYQMTIRNETKHRKEMLIKFGHKQPDWYYSVMRLRGE